MYSAINDPIRWVLPDVLTEMARTNPDKCWVQDCSGESMTFSQAQSQSRRAGQFFLNMGVARGDLVGIFMLNSCNFVRAWLGLGKINCTAVLYNTELRGQFLKHQINDSKITCIVIEAELLESLIEIADQVPALKTIMVCGDVPNNMPNQWTVLNWSQYASEDECDIQSLRASDIATVMYTSGTTGPSKGVLMPHAHCTAYGIGTIECLELTPEDRYYISLPLFHVNGLMMQLGATLLMGVSVFVRLRFSASSWLSDVQKHRSTVTNFIGSTLAFMLAQPPTSKDKKHSIRAILAAPTPPSQEEELRNRFNVPDVLSAYGMTEVNIPVWGRIGSKDPGAAGWTHGSRFEVKIVNPDTDMPVSAGDVGEIVVRPRIPFAFMAGYLNAPDKTIEAWRNMWFHTGDAAFMDHTGRLTFIDRIKDTIRRRGENISASEVEDVVISLPGVSEVAAYAVPSDIPGGEDEVMLAVVLEIDATISPTEISMESAKLLPRFARPRYIQIMQSLPKTATGKVQRAVLRKNGITETTIDCG